MKVQTYEQVVLLGVDPQNDFCPGGSLGVEQGNEVMLVLNKAADYLRTLGLARNTEAFKYVLTADDHPEKTSHFDNWPPHCVRGTFGAKFHQELNTDGATVVRKGTEIDEDAYSGFQGRAEDGRILAEVVKNNQGLRVALVVGGLATDYCVRDTVLDARKEGFDTYVLTDAIRAVNIEAEDGQKALDAMKQAGAVLTNSDKLTAGKVLEVV